MGLRFLLTSLNTASKKLIYVCVHLTSEILINRPFYLWCMIDKVYVQFLPKTNTGPQFKMK